MEFPIKIWTQVRQKSGGSEMIVTSCLKNADGAEWVTCKWKDGREFYMTDFLVENLEIIV